VQQFCNRGFNRRHIIGRFKTANNITGSVHQKLGKVSFNIRIFVIVCIRRTPLRYLQSAIPAPDIAPAKLSCRLDF
jgi:hypothetical protein